MRMPIEPDYTTRWKRRDDIRYAASFINDTSLHAGSSGSGGISEAKADLGGLSGTIVVSKPALMRQRVKVWESNIEYEFAKNALLTKCNEEVKTLTADGVIGNNFVDVADVANLQVGDTMLVVDNAWTDVGGIYNGTVGEIVTINGLRVTLSNNLRHTYTVAQAAKLRSVFAMFQSGFDNPGAQPSGIHLHGLRIDGNYANQSYGITNELHCAIQNAGWTDSLLDNIIIENWHDQAINMSGYRNTLRRAIINACLGMGIQFTGCTNSNISDVTVRNMNNPGNFDFADFYFCAGNYNLKLLQCNSFNAPNHAFRSLNTSNRDIFMECLAHTSNKNGFQIGGDREKLMGCIAINSGANAQGFYLYNTTKAELIGCEATQESGGPTLYGGYVLSGALDTLVMGCLAKGMRGTGTGCGFMNYLNSHRTKYIGCRAYDNIIAGLSIYTSNDVDIHGCTFKADANTQGYGIKVADANCNRIRLRDNELVGNTTGPYLDSSNAIGLLLANEPVRALGSPYQNTTTYRPLLITITLELVSGVGTPATAELRVENATPPTIVRANPSLGSIVVTSRQCLSFIVPYGWYYGVYVTAGTVNLIEWHEQEIG